jgi:hypothetical protein
MSSIADRQPLVVWLDDVQWGDEDSGRLLQQFLEPPDGPTALVILSHRNGNTPKSQTLSALSHLDRSRTDVIDLRLGPMASSELMRLFDRLLGPGPLATSETARWLALESEGLPFFALEIARYLSEQGPGGEGSHTRFELGDLLRRRFSQLSPGARHLVELTAVAGGPLPRRLLFAAAGEHGASASALSELEKGWFVRTSTVDGGRLTEIYHHKIREAVLDTLDPATRRHHHSTLARVMLGSPDANLSTVVDHFDAAGDLDAVRKPPSCLPVSSTRGSRRRSRTPAVVARPHRSSNAPRISRRHPATSSIGSCFSGGEPPSNT